MKSVWMIAALAVAATNFAAAQNQKKQRASPPADTSVTIGGKTLSIKYSAPSVRGRTIFGPGGIISKDPNYPVWRAGANAATAFHTGADLDLGGLDVPAGDYTLFVLVEPEPWQLIVNKQTGQWGLKYDAGQDLGRVPMKMSKPSAPVETYKMTLRSTGSNTGELRLEWADKVATVPFTVK